MAQITKRRKIIDSKVELMKLYSLDDALKILQECPTVKFVESVDIAVNLGIDPKKSEQMLRGAIILPNGTGKNVKVAAFAQGDSAEQAKKAGADIVGFEDLAAEIKGGAINFDVLVATPDAMKLVGQLGQILGPRGLMPNPKVGTVSADIALAVKNAKGGQVQYRTDKCGIVHCTIGKVNFSADKLKENFVTLLSEIKKVKPTGVKGNYLQRITISTTMGPGLQIDQSTIV